MRYDQMCKHQDQRTMTSAHGRLLQDSGFLKLDSPRSSSSSSARTTMQEVTGLYYPFVGDPVGMTALTHYVPSYSGKHATATTQRMVGPSTSATVDQLIASMRSTLDKMRRGSVKQVPLYLPRTYYQRLKSQLLEQGMPLPSWVRCVQHLVLPSYSHFDTMRFARGSMRTRQALALDVVSGAHLVSSGDLSDTSPLPMTRSAIASGKYGSTSNDGPHSLADYARQEEVLPATQDAKREIS